MQVADVMTRSMVTAERSMPVRAAVRLMRQGHFRHLPVVHEGKLVGIVSDRDLRQEDEATVHQVMQPEVITVTCDTPVEVAATLMADNKIGALPVVEPTTDQLVGIISQTDLFVVLTRLLHGTGPSTRLELRLTDLPRQLAVVASAAENQHIPITSLVTVPKSEFDASPTVVLRVGTIDPRAYVDALRTQDIEVDSPIRLQTQ